MDRMEFTKEEQHWLFKTVATVLHVGNLEFAPDGEGSTVANQDRAFTMLIFTSTVWKEEVLIPLLMRLLRRIANCIAPAWGTASDVEGEPDQS